MMVKETSLQTSPELFKGFLRHITSNIAVQRQFPIEGENKIAHVILQEPQSIGRHTLGMIGYVVDGGIYHSLGALIEFEIVPLASESIRVIAKCKQVAFTEYFSELLEEIGQAYGVSWQAEQVPASTMHGGNETDHRGEASATNLPSSAESLPYYKAKTERTRQEHKAVYDLWKEMNDEYHDNLGHDSLAQPTPEELRDRVIDALGKSYKTRQLRNIIRSGKEGHLN